MNRVLVQKNLKMFKNVVKFILDFPNYAQPIPPYENRLIYIVL